MKLCSSDNHYIGCHKKLKLHRSWKIVISRISLFVKWRFSIKAWNLALVLKFCMTLFQMNLWTDQQSIFYRRWLVNRYEKNDSMESFYFFFNSDKCTTFLSSISVTKYVSWVFLANNCLKHVLLSRTFIMIYENFSSSCTCFPLKWWTSWFPFSFCSILLSFFALVLAFYSNSYFLLSCISFFSFLVLLFFETGSSFLKFPC